MIRLYGRFRKILRLRTLQMTMTEKYNKNVEDFLKESNSVFPVFKKDIFELIKKDTKRDKEAKKTDVIYLKNCIKGIMAKFDTAIDKSYGEKVKEHEKKMENIIAEMNKADEREERKRVLLKKSKELDKEKINDYEIEFSSGASASENDSEFEPSPAKKRKVSGNRSRNTSGNKVSLQLSLDDVLEKWVPFLTRYKVGVRAETSLLSTLFQVGGADLDELPVSRSSLHRKRQVFVEQEAQIVREENLDKVRGLKLVIHFDT